MYSSSKVARDRDRLREQVLTGLGWKLYHLWSTDWYRNRDLGRKKLLENVEKSIRQSREEERRRSEEEKKLAEKRRLEAEKKAEELRLAREKEEKERAEKEAEEEVNPEDIGPNDFVEVEKVDDGDILEKPIDVSEINPDEFFDDEKTASSDDTQDNSINEDATQKETHSEFVVADTPDENKEYEETPSEFIKGDDEDLSESAAEEVQGASTVNDDEVKQETSEEDKEIWEAEEELDDQNDDAEVWESDEGIAPEDNAEVWEDDKDYADEESEHASLKDKVKSFFKHDDDADDEEKQSKTSFFSGLSFEKGLGKNSDLDEGTVQETIDNDKVDLGSDDDYIYVDHSNDETVDESEIIEEVEEPSKPDIDENVSSGDKDYSIDESDDIEEVTPEEEVRKETIKKPVFSDKIDFKSDAPQDDVDSNDVHEKRDIGLERDDVDLGSSDVHEERDIGLERDDVDLGSSDVHEERDIGLERDDVDLGSSDLHEAEDTDLDNDDKVDLGSDDDYIYVDHSNDETVDESEIIEEDSQEAEIENNLQKEVNIKNRSKRYDFVKSRISDVVSGESKLEPEEIEIVRGEVIEEDETPLHKPAPKDEYVVEAEIVNGQDYSSDDILEKPTPKENYFEEDEELNIFTDELSDLSHDEYDEIQEEANRVINKAMSEFMKDVFDDDDSLKEPIEDKFGDGSLEEPIEDKFDDGQAIEDDVGSEETAEENVEDITEDDTNELDDEMIYFKGANDVTNPLRKNNVYYKNEHKNKSLRDSIKGIKKDMQYINKSLNEIENPTQIDYVSVVDRTEEYDPNDYLSRPSDDDSDKIIQMEEESKFAEKEEQRIENEFMSETFDEQMPDDDVIVPISGQFNREELRDQALEDIIQTANDDYKEIEKERFKSSNQLKAFDDKKLPGKKKLEDEIVDYVQATDIGLSPQNDLYALPISKIADSIKTIVDIESPIHVKEVTNRVKDSCNIKRAGSNLKKTVNLAIDEAENSGDIIKIGDFLYDASNNNVIIRKRNKPNIDLISDEEISKSIELVLIHKQNVTTKQVAKEASRNFGFKSTSKKTASRINGVLDLMIANNRVKIVNDYVELN